VCVRGWREGAAAVIAIEDQGVGIDSDEQSRIFQRFYRARTSAGIAGTGIGLNLVKMLVEHHAGSVTVESVPGVGSTFTVRLPLDGPPLGAELRQAA
jgi:signal transduction histidine kinase